MMSLILLQTGSPAAGLSSLLLPVVILGVMYLVLFLPMQRQKKQQAKMLSELKIGDHVLTSGGIIGTIVTLNDDNTMVVRVTPDGVKLQMARSAVASVLSVEGKS